MSLTIELAKIAARTVCTKRANIAMPLLSRLGGAAARLLPKSTGGRIAAGLGTAGGAHLGQDAYRSYHTDTPNLQRYYDQNQVASKALSQQAARLSAPSGFRDAGAGPSATPKDVSVGQLVGQNAPRLDVEAPTNSFLRTLARPVHETRMNFGGDPGAYKPPALKGEMAVAGGERRITNPDGTVSTLGPAVAPTTTTQQTNRSKQLKWLADMDAAQTGAAVNRYQQEGAKILPKAQEALGQNIQDTRGAHQAGNQQYGQSRARTESLWRQLGLDPSNMPQELNAPDTAGAEKQHTALSQLNAGQPAAPPPGPTARGIDDYSLEELAKIVAQRQAKTSPSPATQPVPPAVPGVAPPAGNREEMDRRRRIMNGLAREWNAY